MTNIELWERLFGPGMVAEIDWEPSLTWSDHVNLERSASAAEAVAERLGDLTKSMADLSLSVYSIGNAVARLEATMDLRMVQQAELLSTQLTLLASIADAVRTPAKTRAAERIVDCGELLRRHRWQRAVDVATLAVEDDPNNPAAYSALAWAQLGLLNLNAARDAFREAAEAADGLERSGLARRCARVTAMTDDPADALAVLDRYGQRRTSLDVPATLGEEWDAFRAERLEVNAVCFDTAAYLAASGRTSEAMETLDEAGARSADVYVAVSTDPLMSSNAELVSLVGPALKRAASAQLEQARAHLDAARATLRELEAIVAELDGGPWPDAPEPREDGPQTTFETLIRDTIAEIRDSLMPDLERAIEEGLGIDENRALHADAIRSLNWERDLLVPGREALELKRAVELRAQELQREIDEKVAALVAAHKGVETRTTLEITVRSDPTPGGTSFEAIVRSKSVARAGGVFRGAAEWTVTLNKAHTSVVTVRDWQIVT